MKPRPKFRRLCATLLVAASVFVAATSAHPLGNFSVNQFAGIQAGLTRVRVHYVVDMAEIAAFQELRGVRQDANRAYLTSDLNAYLERIAPQYAAGLKLLADDAPIALQLTSKTIQVEPGAVGLPTLRLTFDFVSSALPRAETHRFQFENTNLSERSGWRELMLTPISGTEIYDSAIPGSSLSNELKNYPEQAAQAPLNERAGAWTATRGALPANAKRLTTRDGQAVRPVPSSWADALQERFGAPWLLGLALLMLGGLLWLWRARQLRTAHA